MTKGALLLVLNNKNEVLLQHKDAGAPLYANQWCLFGGGIEAGETADKTIKREFKEELEWPVRNIAHIKEYDGNDVFLKRTMKSADDLKKHLHEGNDARFFSKDRLGDIDIATPHKEIIQDYFSTKPVNILFICRGNAFRSIIAEAYVKSLGKNLHVTSRGTVASENRDANNQRFAETQELLKKHGLQQFTKTKHAEQLTQQDINNADLVICVNDQVFNGLSTDFQLPKNTLTWDIPDINDPGFIPNNRQELLELEEFVFSSIHRHVDTLCEKQTLV